MKYCNVRLSGSIPIYTTQHLEWPIDSSQIGIVVGASHDPLDICASNLEIDEKKTSRA